MEDSIVYVEDPKGGFTCHFATSSHIIVEAETAIVAKAKLLALQATINDNVGGHEELSEIAIPFTYTVLYKHTKEGNFVGYIKEMPGAISQGGSLPMLIVNLRDAIKSLNHAAKL